MASALNGTTPPPEARQEIIDNAPPEEQATLLWEYSALSIEEPPGDEEGIYPVPEIQHEVNFPRLLSGRQSLTMARAQVEDEISLILEMGAEGEGKGTPLFYALEALEPSPFSPREKLTTALHSSRLWNSLVQQARAGFLIHEDLYALEEARPGEFHEIVSGFLEACDVIETKLKRPFEEFYETIEVSLF